ncbi:MAG: hypothetical protein EBQ97_00300 [Bacteroidetes bacterium]|nr:hypothetical protein [Bacteroidota bacterium]
MTQPIDRLFERLSMTYGIAWDNSLGSAPLNEIKSHWMHELSGFLKSKESMMSISWALDHLPERPPNLVQFKNLCYQAPAVERPQLPAPPADPARVIKELSKLADMRITTKRVDPKEWARKILGDYAAGAKKSPTVVEMARNALES